MVGCCVLGLQCSSNGWGDIDWCRDVYAVIGELWLGYCGGADSYVVMIPV